jgi:cell wall-associated NlpC family hydrolase
MKGDIPMKRVYAVAAGLALSLTPVMIDPGSATADPRTTAQPIETVIQRALSQRGMPFVYGGGNTAGPTNGIRPDAGTRPGRTAVPPGTAALPDSAAVPGLTALPGTATAPGTAAVPGTDGTPAARTVGFDASGLIQYAFAGAGIKMPRTSGEQCSVGRKIPPAQARRGDLICYGPGGSQSVALFLGNGQMLETDGTAVVVSPVRTKEMTPYLTRIIES